MAKWWQWSAVEAQNKSGDGARTWHITGLVSEDQFPDCGWNGYQSCRLADVYSIEKNAKMIAAAPEMFRALADLLADPEDRGVDLTDTRAVEEYGEERMAECWSAFVKAGGDCFIAAKGGE